MIAVFKTDRIEVAWETERNSGWAFQGQKVKGVEWVFSAVDRNYLRQNRWTFVVRVPNDITKNYISVMPTAIPNRKVWAGLERRSLQFRYGTIGRHAKRLYAKLSIEDLQGDKNKRVLTENDDPLPSWIEQFDPKPKRKVASTDGNDGRHLVSLVEPGDFAAMIRLFIALKGWVRDEKYSPQKAWDKETTRRRRLVTDKPLRGKQIAITGRLVRGIRTEIYEWFRRLGAEPKDHVTKKTDLLIVGVHYKDDDRKKIRDADELKIPQLSESKFYRKYSL
jgi:NAD-dependent DNA ligase